MRSQTQRRFLRVFGSSLGITLEAFACPDCATTKVVRASIFDERFWDHTVRLLLPLLVLVLIVVVLHQFGLNTTARSSDSRETHI